MKPKPISRQRKWSKQMQAEGRCIICGEVAQGLRCAVHLEIHRAADREAKRKLRAKLAAQS